MLMYSGCSSWLVAWVVVRDADRLRDFASEFLLLSLLGLRDRPLADLVLFLEALGSVGRSAEENRVKWVQVQGAGAKPAPANASRCRCRNRCSGCNRQKQAQEMANKKNIDIYCVCLLYVIVFYVSLMVFV